MNSLRNLFSYFLWAIGAGLWISVFPAYIVQYVGRWLMRKAIERLAEGRER